jgi:UDP-3-O-[3-hydroxymyristoyl] glucosamine N-acyltransferase
MNGRHTWISIAISIDRVSEVHRMLAVYDGVAGRLLALQDPTAKVGNGCKLGPNVVVGPNCVVGDGVRITNAALLAGGKHHVVDGGVIPEKEFLAGRKKGL